MDIAAASIAMSQASLAQQVGIAVTKKALDTMDDNSQALIKMMELSVNPNVGSQFDATV